MQQPPKKKIGEITKASSESEKEPSVEELKAKTRKQIQDQEMMKETIRQNKANEKSGLMKTIKFLLNK